MRTAQGGTQIHCPYCKEVRICSAVSPSLYGESSNQRIYFVKHTDVQIFRRCRFCLTCEQTFLTAEVDEDLLNELVQLREALKTT